MKPVWMAGLLAVILALSAIPALAQPVISAKSGLISYVEGKVFLSDQVVEPSPTHFPDVKENAMVRTDEGRAEVLLTPGVILRLGENSSIKMLTNRLIDTRLELLTGSAVVEADEIAKDTNVTLVCKDGTVSLSKKGLYRFDTAPARVKVFEGLATANIAGQNFEVATGKMLSLGGTLAAVEKFNKEDTDSLDNWSKRRGELVAMANVSAAKQVHDSGCAGYSFVTPVSTTTQPCLNPCAPGWRYNPWYGMITYIPCGTAWSPYGYRYWSPMNVMRAYYTPPVYNGNRGYGGYGGGGGVSYPTMAPSSGGYAGTVASAPAASSGPSMSSGSTAAASAGSSSAGHGATAGGGGGRGR
ncbi:MAG TPA: hypothetical protein VKF41_06510 [Bryobacteraceae bacterium]|nr:hypothetical protein [Bryobacteraceae bacterium]